MGRTESFAGSKYYMVGDRVVENKVAGCCSDLVEHWNEYWAKTAGPFTGSFYVTGHIDGGSVTYSNKPGGEGPQIPSRYLTPAPLFAVGDKVRAVSGTALLFVGNEYTVTSVTDKDVFVKVKNGNQTHTLSYPHEYFELLPVAYAACAAAEVDNLADEYGGRKVETKFVAGERVRYTGKHKEYHRPEDIGALGTVKNSEGSLVTTTVDWDQGGPARTVYTANIELVPLPATLTIQAGRYYKTRDGRKVGPMRAYTGSENNAHPWQANIDGGYHGCTTGFIFKLDGRNYEYTNLDLISEWPVEVAPVVAPATTAKFKVGDRVKVGLTGNEYTITSTRMGRLGKIIYDAVGAGKSGGSFFAEHLDLLPAATTTTIADIVRKHSGTAVVMLIENGQPKPSEAPHVHSNQWLAGEEASRLAGIHKGQEFGVYECVDVRKVERPAYEHEWQRLAATGRVIEAIKTLRAMTGLGLKTSKNAVEDWLSRELLAA